VPLQVAPQTELTKSAFFPITPAPSRLVVNFSSGGEARAISLELPDLAGLHLRVPRARAPQAVKTAVQVPAVSGKKS
jgi:hypothetical protein